MFAAPKDKRGSLPTREVHVFSGETVPRLLSSWEAWAVLGVEACWESWGALRDRERALHPNQREETSCDSWGGARAEDSCLAR